MKISKLSTSFILILGISFSSFLHAEKMSKSEILKKMTTFQQKINADDEKPKSEQFSLLLQDLCQLRANTISTKNMLEEQSQYYPELDSTEFDSLLEKLNHHLAYQDQTLCEVLSFEP